MTEHTEVDSDLAGTDPPPAEKAARADASAPPIEDRRSKRALVLVILGVLAVTGAAFAAWFYLSTIRPAVVPNLISLSPYYAEHVLAGANLKSGLATYEVTKEFPEGRIIGQAPAPYRSAVQGSAVSIRVAVAPKPIVVPDIGLADSSYAAKLLRYDLLVPRVLYAYSRGVRAGSVIEQLPRAGDTAVTGSDEIIVVSLGPGTSGVVVPRLIGLTFTRAHTIAASATLFPQPRAVVATGSPDGTVIDQAPSAGSLVQVATRVWVSIATPAGETTP